jgi:hypothetical protein
VELPHANPPFGGLEPGPASGTVVASPPEEEATSHPHTSTQETPDRKFVLGQALRTTILATLGPGDYYVVPPNVPHMVRFRPEGTRVLVFSSPEGFAELVARAGTAAHLGTPETELDTDLFMAVSTELGDVVLGPRGPRPRSWPTP